MSDKRHSALWQSFSRGLKNHTEKPNRLLKNSFYVMPAKAGIQNSGRKMDFRFRGNDNEKQFPTFSASC